MTRGRQAALAFTALGVVVVAVLVGRSVISGPRSSAPAATTSTPAGTTTSPATTTGSGSAPGSGTGGASGAGTGGGTGAGGAGKQYPPTGYTAFSDMPAGYEIAYPKSWTRLRSNDRQADLLVAHGTSATNGVSMLVRVTPLPALGVKGAVTNSNVKAVRPAADQIIHAGGFAHVIGSPKTISLDGVPGFLYLYTFAATPGQPAVAHAHYLLFKGDALIAIVFQVTPAVSLAKLAPMLDLVARTFRATSH